MFFPFAVSATEKTNINSATVKELKKLDGIGKKLAVSIIEYREKNGLFQSIDDLKKIKGIGKKTFEKIRDVITVSSEGEKSKAPEKKK